MAPSYNVYREPQKGYGLMLKWNYLLLRTTEMDGQRLSVTGGLSLSGVCLDVYK